MSNTSKSRMGWLFAAAVSVVVLSVGLGDRLITHVAYALENGRIQANSDELAGVQEVARAFRMVAKVTRPGVVYIRVSGIASPDARKSIEERLRQQFGDRFDDEQIKELLRRHFEQPGSTGSGIIFDAQGHILTNNHVVAGRSEITVRLRDERQYSARVVGTDRKTDLAILKIDAPDLHPLTFGDSDAMEVGDWVLAVGAPFGLSQSVTHGIISAKGRANIAGMGGIQYQDFLQTDAAINPGNSGGPLVNLRGEVVGVNTAISTNGGSYNVGVAFTIPSNMALRVAKQLIAHGEVARGWLGVSLSELTAADVELFGLKDRRGALVDVLYAGSPAQEAGLRCEDVIVAVNKTPVKNIRELRAAVADITPGQRAALKIIRDGRERTLQVNLGKQPESIGAFTLQAKAIAGRELEPLALRVRAMRPELPDTLADRARADQDLVAWARQFVDSQGVFVIGYADADDARKGSEYLVPGVMIVRCDGKPVASVGELQRALESARTAKSVKLVVVEPDGERRTVRVKRQ